MYCCKTNARFLKRLSYLINEAERNFSATVTEVQKKLPEYPPILDLSYFATKRRERDVMHNYLKCIPTVEEKQIELNMPRYYGWKSFHIKEGVIPYNALPYAQYITKTHLASTDNLPSSYDDIVQNETLDNLVDALKKPFEDMLIFEHNFINKDYQYTEEQLNDPVLQDNLKAKSISQKVHRILLSHLSLKYPHLIEAQVDDNPRIEAFWFSGGLPPHDGERKLRTKCLVPDIREDPDRPVQKPFQYYGSPMFQLRHCLPLKEILSLEESENLDFPHVSRDPIIEGYFDDRKHATNIPGFWPGDTNEFGLLSYHNRGYLKKRVKEFLDDDEAITTQAIFASYAWLTSQAFYQGFTTFNEITYPLINQAIITNGQYWSFCVYQLNTMANCVDRFFENPRRNICWISKPLKLFDSIENGKVNGLNPDVIKNLIKFYANKPVARLGIEMKPNLGVEKYIAGHEDDEKRNWLEGIYKNLVSNRPRHRLPPEIYLWQRIYLIRHKMRPLDKKFEPWEFGINRYKRRLDDYAPVYIPRFVRGDFHRRKRKFARTYYPTREQYDPTFVKEYEYTKKKIRTYLDDPKPSV